MIGSMSNALTGSHWIDGAWVPGKGKTFEARNPATGDLLQPAIQEGTSEEVEQAMQAAAASFDALRTRPAEDRAALLDSIAAEIEALGEDLLVRAGEETALPAARLTGERGRTIGQARLFASMIREGSWVMPHIDTAQPDRQPLPKPDVRSMQQPIGPVVVFGASNFPLAIGVVGTDTVAALGAGCPVVVKGHPGHPGTCEMLTQAVARALEKHGFPAGCFSLVQGAGHEVGMALVRHPLTRAVAFTGSLRGGRALCDAAASRPDPIPVYAEMGSSNPVFLLPGALAERAEAIAAGFVQSVTMGVGQFCTNPGLVLGGAGDSLARFRTEVAKLVEASAPATMLHAGICQAYTQGLETLSKAPGLELLARSSQEAGLNQAACTIFGTSLQNFLQHPELVEENFGPSSILIECGASSDYLQVAEGLAGHLTATVHGTEEDLAQHADLIRILERKVGRIVFNGFPTGIEVCPSMHHGGFYPAASDFHFTSIGTQAIYRFTRPVCYQGFPQAALPEPLRNDNPGNWLRQVNGAWTRDAVQA